MANIFYSKTVTVYNRYVSGLMETETWLPTVLDSVRLLVTKGANINASGMQSADSAKLHIMKEKITKPYLMAIKWQELLEEEKKNYVTFQENIDFFVEGDTSVEDITQEDFFQSMKNKYDHCFKVTTVDSYDLIPHFEIGGE